MNPAIIIIAYNRTDSLNRLLNAIQTAHFSLQNIPLVISIDHSENQEVETIADNFSWQHGKKTVIKHKTHLGLKKHIETCGSLLSTYTSAVFLEDDLVVSPYFYDYTFDALAAFSRTETVAGISLYTYQYTENGFLPFFPIVTKSDNYFMQVASSWGQIWTAQQWSDFKQWYEQNSTIKKEEKIPNYIREWGENSWKKHFIRYLIAENKYFVFPTLALATNFSDKGTHATTENLFQVPLQLEKKEYKFTQPNDSTAVYDAWFEINPQSLNKLVPELSSLDYDVDLYGRKELNILTKDTTLTTRKGTILKKGYDLNMFPLLQNILLKNVGNKINFISRESLIEENTPSHTFFQTSPNAKTLFKKLICEQFSFSLIIPVFKYNQVNIITTLNSLKNQTHRHFSVYIVLNNQQEIDAIKNVITNHFPFKIIFLNNDSQEIVEKIKTITLTSDAFGILLPESIWTENTLHEIRMIFQCYKQINWLQQTKSTKNNFINMKSRVNYEISLLEKKSTNLSGMFFKCSVFELIQNNNSDKTFIETLLKNEKLYLVAKQWSSDKQVDFFVKPEIKKYSPPFYSGNILKKIMLPVFYYVSKIINSHYIHGLFTWLYNLPPIVRQSKSTNDFYIENF